MSESRRTMTGVLAVAAAIGIAGASPAIAEDGLIIGHSAAVTGVLAPYDGPDGVACRIEQINEEGGVLGKPVTLMTRDTKSDPVMAANFAQEMIDAGASVLLGPPTDDGLIPMAALALPSGIPVLSVGSTQAAFPKAMPENGYLVPYGDNASAAAAAEIAYAAGHRKAVLMIAHDTGAYSLLTPEYFAQAFERLGGEIVGRVDYHHDLTDLSPQVTTIANMEDKPDMIFAAILLPVAGILLRNLASADVELPVYGTDGFDDPNVISMAGPGGALLTFITHGFPAEGSRLKAFYDDCTKRGYNVQNVFFGLGGEAVEVIKAAVEAAGSFDPAAINAALKEIDGLQGLVSESITYKDQNGVPKKQMVALQIKDGEFVPVEWPTPSWIPEP